MIDWQRTLDLTPEYEDTDPEDTLALQTLARIIARRLRDVAPLDISGPAQWLNARRTMLIKEFFTLAQDPEITKDDFNRVMVWLYDWGDSQVRNLDPNPGPPGRKCCWIKT